MVQINQLAQIAINLSGKNISIENLQGKAFEENMVSLSLRG